MKLRLFADKFFQKVTVLFCVVLLTSGIFAQEIKIPAQEIQKAEQYINRHGFQQKYAFFINFKIPSNRYRFFVYDFKQKKIIAQGLVAHGSGSVIPNSSRLRFSNIENSYQSSLGKYQIMSSYQGQFGLAYRLKGLDATNNNALRRAIVLHSYTCVPNKEISQPLCLSLGCPMVSGKFLRLLSHYINSSKKPVLLTAFY